MKLPGQILSFLGAFFILLCACNGGIGHTPTSTPYFDSVLSNADKMHDAGGRMEALAMVMAAHARPSKRLSLLDEINYYIYCSDIYKNDLKDNDKYIACADSIITVLDKSNSGEYLADRYVQANNMKADALFSKGLYDESYEYYYKTKRLAIDNDDTNQLSQINYSLGMVMYRQQKFSEAANHFIESYNVAVPHEEKFTYFYRKQELLDNIGLSYYHAKQYDSAMVYYRRAIACIDAHYMKYEKSESFYISAKAVVYGNMAELYIILKNYDTAKALLKKSIDINLQKGYINSDAILAQVKLAALYLNTSDKADVKVLLQDIKAELDSIPNKQVELSLNKLMWQYYSGEKDPEAAYPYLKAYVLMDDSLVASNKTMMTSDVEGTIRSLEKQYQIRQLKENNLQERIYLLVASIVVLMALVIILLILKNMQRSRENIKDLTGLNAQVNEQKEKLQTALTELELKDKDKTRILRSAAHDVLNPIAAISGLTDILLTSSGALDADQTEMLQLIKEACDNSISLSKDILEAASATDKHNLVKEHVNINKLLTNSIDLFSLRANAKHQQIVLTTESENVTAFVNKEKIWRVINNLIGNAIKFSYPDSVIEVGLTTIDGDAVISVKDKGTGISEKNKPYIFDVFSEAKMPGTSGEAPHGLGLSISLQIAKAHEGTIWFESEEGNGSVFYLSFPLNSDRA